jgi:hypothetical protein
MVEQIAQQTPSPKKTKKQKKSRAKLTRGVTQAVMYLLCKHKTLSSNPSPIKIKEEEEKEKKENTRL